MQLLGSMYPPAGRPGMPAVYSLISLTSALRGALANVKLLQPPANQIHFVISPAKLSSIGIIPVPDDVHRETHSNHNQDPSFPQRNITTRNPQVLLPNRSHGLQNRRPCFLHHRPPDERAGPEAGDQAKPRVDGASKFTIATTANDPPAVLERMRQQGSGRLGADN